MKGFFITFEGPEGCGKSTHVKMLAAYLRRKGYQVRTTREPGGTAIGKNIRKLLLQTRREMAHLAEVFLFMADRRQHVEEFLEPRLRRGEVVICDRYADSTIAYQVGGRKLNPKLIGQLCEVASCGLKPNLTFLLDIPAEQGLKRIDNTKYSYDRFESEQIAFHRRVRVQFLQLAKAEPRRIKVIDSRQSIAAVQAEICRIIGRYL